ncbi:MAG TPA: hypothetical protein VNQ77_05075 [Frankiaceae bacterium]|nr:hypothetical protein [Frankiaceae bacterium]
MTGRRPGPPSPERDGAASLHDVEAEAGDEEGLDDLFVVDHAEARALGIELDPVPDGEPGLT